MADLGGQRSEEIFVGLKSLCEYHRISGIRDGWLRQLSANPKRSFSELSAMLPPTLMPLAVEIWELVTSAEAGEKPTGPGGSGISRDAVNSDTRGSSGGAEAPTQRITPEPAQGVSEAITTADPHLLADLSDPQLLRDKVDELLPTMDYTRDVNDDPELLGTRPTKNGTALRWKVRADDEQVTLYRVVSTYEHPAYDPDAATTLALTTGRDYTDARRVEAALRYYQVWSYTADTMEDIAWSQPELLAQDAVCAEPVGLHAVDEGGRIILKWRLPQGATRASVYRLPQSRAGQIRPRDERYRIQPDGNHLSGLQDMQVEPGAAYIYHVHAEVEVGQIVHHSTPVKQSVVTRARVLPVTDLECQTREANGDSSFDLAWTAPPSGEVHIYRTEDAPPSGIVDQITMAEQLPKDFFALNRQLPHPITHDLDSRQRMPLVEWDEQWARVYFTPVTFLDGRAAVGHTISQVRTQPVRDVHMHERLHRQILTLRWPDSADEVQVFLTGPNDTSSPHLADQKPDLVCKKGEYVKDGRIALALMQDCTIHLVPVIFSKHEAFRGAPVSLAYRRPWQVDYSMQMKKRLFGDVRGELSVASRDRLPSKPAFVLVHNASHLPLHADDGRKVEVTPVTEETYPPSQVFSPPKLEAPLGTFNFSFALPKGAAGFLRVFAVQVPDEHFDKVAVLDPPIRHLRLT